MRKVVISLRVLFRPQIIIVGAALCLLIGGLRLAGTMHPAPPLHTPAAPQVAGMMTPLPARPLHPDVDCAARACLALTFDDGPHRIITPQVLDILDRHNARATFFVLGERVAGNEALLRRMYGSGHEIGNHSWDHHDFTNLDIEQMQQQITHTQEVIVRAGIPAPTLFRPPYGSINAVVRSRVPLAIALWNIDPEDWHVKDAGKIVTHLQTHAIRGGVVDLHDTYQSTADALDQLVRELQQHYQLVTFSELFDLGAGQPGVFYGR